MRGARAGVGFVRDPEENRMKRRRMGLVSRVLAGVRLSALVLAVLGPLDGLSQSAEPMTPARIRALTRSARASGGADPTELVLALDARVRAQWGDFESFPVSIVRREDLNIVLTTPYMTYRRTLVNYLRIGRPIAEVPWIAAAVIAVEPERIDAPDITRLVVERGGRAVPPLENLLRPMTYMNGSGDQALIHAGEARFPLSAFAPGAPVTISAIPRAGAAFVMALSDEQLRTLK
jgi:hypothetical protein